MSDDKEPDTKTDRELLKEFVSVLWRNFLYGNLLTKALIVVMCWVLITAPYHVSRGFFNVDKGYRDQGADTNIK